MSKYQQYFIFLLIAYATLLALPARAQTIETTNSFPDITLSIGETERILSGSIYQPWVAFIFSFTPSTTPFSLSHVEYCSHPLCSWKISKQSQYFQNIYRDTIVDTNAIQAYLTSLQEETRHHPENAQFVFNEETQRVDVFNPGIDGEEIDKDTAIPVLEKAIESTAHSPVKRTKPIMVSLPLQILLATTRSEDATQLGITSLIGEGESDFSGSSNDRIFNIRFAMEKFHGTILAPGEELSFVDILGEVDKEHGWRPELVIRNNRTEPEYGGGICQVSTTLFRAAVYSGLRITMRQNHSYPVKYYRPIGFDASVYVPMPDLRFVNNTEDHILIQGSLEKTKLVFRLYGTDDGRSVSVTEPEILEKREDGSMRTMFTQTVTTKDGETLLEKSFFSNYDNPDNYPKPEDIDLTEKPKDWSKRQWEEYKKEIQSYLKNR